MQKSIKQLFLTMIISLIIGLFTIQIVSARPSLQAATGDVIIYGSNNSDYAVVEINLSQNITNLKGTASLPNQAIAQDPLTKYIYMYEAFSTGDEFFYWDPATLTDTVIIQYVPPPGDYAKRMDFAPDGTLYVMDSFDNIYTLDKENGDGVFLGSVPGMVISDTYGATGDIAFAPDGTAYVATYENIYSIEFNEGTSTWSSTLLIEDMFAEPSGLDYLWTGLAYCNDTLYGSSGEQQPSLTDWKTSIYRIDLVNETKVKVIDDVGTRFNDLTSCQPKVEMCELQENQTYDFYIDPFTATVDIDTLGNLDCISMNRYNESHPNATTPLETGTYWDIAGVDDVGATATGFTVTLTLSTLFPTDLQDKVCRYTGSGWDCAMDSVGTQSVTREGITEFSEWTVGDDTSPSNITLQTLTAQKDMPKQAVWLLGLLLASIILLGYRKRYSSKNS